MNKKCNRCLTDSDKHFTWIYKSMKEEKQITMCHACCVNLMHHLLSRSLITVDDLLAYSKGELVVLDILERKK